MAYRKTAYVESKLSSTRERILAVARNLVEAGGWGNCSLAQIASGAGVANGSIYTHFGKVSDLYNAVFLAIAEEELAIISAIADEEVAPDVRLEKAVRTFARRAMRGPVKAYAVIAEPVTEETDGVRQAFRTRFIDAYRRIIADGIRCGAFRRGDPLIMATCVVGAMTEALIKPISVVSERSEVNRNRVSRELLDFCLGAVRPVSPLAGA